MTRSSLPSGDRTVPWRTLPYLVLAASLLGLILSLFFAVSFGAKELTNASVWQAVTAYDPALPAHQIIRELRLPRVLGAALLGAAFAVAGALMQGVTRNPLADPGILGINSGAMLAVALSFAFFPNLPYAGMIALAFGGAVCSTLIIYLLASSVPGGLTPLRLTVAGSVVAALLGSLCEGIAIYYELSQDLAFWYAGGAAGVKWMHLKLLLPVILAALLFTVPLARSVSLLSLGEETASGLGIRTGRVRVLAMATAVLLAGASVSAVGPVGFVGLVVPHMARKLIGGDYRLILPLSALLGALLLVLADLAARTVNPPRELALGVMVAMIGVPFFLYLARQERSGL
ncbi:iron ABC transporter permease [Paenibacillus mucilaginosus]|uniref:Transport system permease protein n=1 Tax=Paenibacillus mucilaginosus (strain KNP414) TaxID=1036673 RepID=F8FIR7_PAEMK|nr:iron ABC transporter permease [Paenibacillus mucilaginosus]AEI45521.1 Transport system permease protein [Paenibacillus mucilaginosus KNP414]MCG7215276.1 iron ABC transporter permease [Paenibacillus mucilaginosus]WDM26941.1 iron ABC transporter permease [Paenibacillus mucilaginosus]